MAITNDSLKADFDIPARLPPNSQRYIAWTPEWYAALGTSKSSVFHVNALLDQVFRSPVLNVRALNVWISNGGLITKNYIQPRLTLATKIIYITKGFRYTAYTNMWLRRTRFISNEVALKNLN